MRNAVWLILSTFILMVVVGCSGSVTDSPITPSAVQQTTGNTDSHYLWGLWQFILDPETGSVETVPMREGSLHVNVLKFLEPPSGQPKLHISNFVFNNPICDLDVQLVHPFPGLDQYIGFDVAGILISRGSQAGFNNPALVMPGAGDTRLLNADGYTRWWNPVEFGIPGQPIFRYRDGKLGIPDSVADFNCTLNGYKLFADEIETNGDILSAAPTNRLPFFADSSNSRHYTIDFSGGLVFNYAVDANWALPDVIPPVDVNSFPPEANRPEAWAISVSEIENTLFNDGSTYGGDLTLLVRVRDHYSADLDKLYLESPGNFVPAVVISPIDNGDGYADFEVDINNATPQQDAIDILLQVESDVMGYADVLTGEKVTAYFTYTAEVSSILPQEAPTAFMHATTSTEISPGEQVSFDATASTGTPPLTFIWDFDGDGIYSDMDPGDFYIGDQTTPVHEFPIEGLFDVRVKVTNALGFDISDPVMVNVGPLGPDPVAAMHATTPTTIPVGGTVSFDATDSTGTQPLTYNWDFDGDGEYDDVDPDDTYVGSPEQPTHAFDAEGDFDVTLKVTNVKGSDVAGPVIVHVGLNPNDVYVDGDYAGSDSDGSMTKPFKTVQDGMNAVTAGHKIHVDFFDSGPDQTYDTAGLVLKSSVTLLGDNWNGGGPGKPKLDNETEWWVVGMSWGTIDNFTLEGFQLGVANVPGNDEHWGVFIPGGTNITIRHNKFTDYADDTGLVDADGVPIYLSDCSDSKIEFNDIGPFTWHSDTPGEYATVLWGIYTYGCSNIEINNNFIHDYLVDYSGGGGQIRVFLLHCQNSTFAEIHNNLICHISGIDDYDYRINGINLEGYTGSHEYHCYNNTVDLLDTSQSIATTSPIGLIFYSAQWCEPFSNTYVDNGLVSNLWTKNAAWAYGYVGTGWYNEGTGVWSYPGIQYSTAWNVSASTDFFGTSWVFGDGLVNVPGIDPLYVNNTTQPYDYHFLPGTDCEMGNPDFIDWDDTGAPSGDPDEPDIQNRSRMGCFGGPYGDWDPNNL